MGTYRLSPDAIKKYLKLAAKGRLNEVLSDRSKRLTSFHAGIGIALETPRQNAMKSSRSKRGKRKASIISSISRPLAPAWHPLSAAKPDPKARPADAKQSTNNALKNWS